MAMTESEARAQLEGNLAQVEKVLDYVCRRRGIRGDEAEDFRSWVMVKLLEEDCRVLRSFRGQSSWKTYLTVVVVNFARDYRIHRWGRYRSSSSAQRLGYLAEHLELLLRRDGHSFEEAVAILQRNFSARASWQELEALAGQLPERSRLRFDGEWPETDPRAESEADERALSADQLRLQERVIGAFRAGLTALAPEDRLILRLRFVEGLTVAAIARTLRLDQRRTYSRIPKILRLLRACFEEREMGREELAALLNGSAPWLEGREGKAAPLASLFERVEGA